MRTYFQLDEPDEFEAAKNMLVRRCAAWAARRGLDANTKVLEAALLSRHLSVDGRLALWRPNDVVRLLLEWIPAKVIADPAELADAPATLRTLLAYLADTGLRDPRGGPPETLEASITLVAHEYPAAPADPARYGMVKYWSMLAREHGVDPGDPTAMDDFRKEITAGRVPYDPELLDRLIEREMWQSPPGSERTFGHLPIVLPPPAELTGAASRSRIVRQLITLTEWVARTGKEGVPLTALGHLKLADARRLAELLGTGEEVYPMRSSAELRELGLIVAWAKELRLIRVRKRRLLAVARMAPLLAAPDELWRRAFDAFFRLGESVCEPLRADGPPSMLLILFKGVLTDLLSAMYGMRVSAPIARLRESIWLTCGRRFHLDDATEAQVRGWKSHMARDLRRAMDTLAALGAVELTEGMPDRIFTADLEPRAEPGMTQPFTSETRARLLADLAQPSPLVRLTPLALREIRARLLAEGREAGLVGELAEAPVAEMLGVVCQHYSPETRAAEIAGWLDAHGTDIETETETLLNVARSCPFRGRTASIVSALAEIHPSGRRLLHRLRSDPVLAPTALATLMELNVLTRDDLTEPEQVLVMAEGFLNLMELGGPPAVHVALAEMTHTSVEEALDRLLNSRHPDSQGLDDIRVLVAEPLRARNPALRKLPPPGSRPHPSLRRGRRDRRGR